MTTLLRFFCVVYLLSFTVHSRAEKPQRPNVILVMTDDQGYGDLGCHGNKIIQTPNLDQLHKQSVRLTNFHVDPTCSPTRSALMTGRYSTRTGVWHTIMGRSMLASDEITMADVFHKAGYQTGIFGKWHLGDNYPLRPQDKGFQEVLVHGGGGVGQTPDFWGNDYFGDTYFHNGKPEKFKKYCTDVFFDGALKFIEKNKKAKKPFFCYVPTNAPHGPYLVAEKYEQLYTKQGIPGNRAKFWGMITNIDENMGRLLAKLKEWNLEDNTLLIFMTDNGTSAGGGRGKGAFNAAMRGQKGSEYEGGHRVPCFLRYPTRWQGGRDVDQLTAHIDLLPTLADICELKMPSDVKIDGTSLVPLLTGEGQVPERTLFVHSQRIEHPQKWRKCSVMTQRWRLINGKELYDIQADPGQKKDVSKAHAEVVKTLRGEYEQWYSDLSKSFDRYVRIVIGSEHENPSWITCHDWHGPQVPWNHGHIRRTMKANGFWAIDVKADGKYRFTLHRQPPVDPAPLLGDRARVKVGDLEASKAIPAGATKVSLEMELKKGKTRLQTFIDKGDKSIKGAYFVEVERLPK